MSLLLRGEWFDRLTNPGSLSEAEYERLIVQQAPHLFPNYTMVKYRLDVVSDEYTRRPDFALIHNAYTSWWVVEIELIEHSLHSHVLPQVACFAAGSYGPALAEYFARGSQKLKQPLLQEMLKGAPPGVLIVVNAYSEEWARNITPYGAQLSVVTPYRSERNRHIFDCRLAEIEGPPSVLTLCRRDRALPRLWIVDSPAALAAIEESALTIYFDGSPSRWTRLKALDRVWLNPVQRSPIPDDVQTVELAFAADGKLVFQ